MLFKKSTLNDYYVFHKHLSNHVDIAIEYQESVYYNWNSYAWQKISKQPYSLGEQLDVLSLKTDFIDT